MGKRVLAFDLGASSGRAILAEWDGTRLKTEELHRFPNDPVMLNGTLYWDILRLMHEIKTGITKGVQSGGFDSIGIDTWGIDFGLLDGDGVLLENPVNYRDVRTKGVLEQVAHIIPLQELYQRSGVQLLDFNTIFQLYYLAKERPQLLERAETMLLIPDLISYFLTGQKRGEFSNVSTTQMLRLQTETWDVELLNKLGIPTHLLPPLIESGESYGSLTDEICQELNCPKVPVIAVCTHDTASAVAAVPSDQEEFVYISCGTWSLFGTERNQPLLNAKDNLTNERGYARNVRLLKNIMGLWLIQQCRKQWIKEGEQVSYGDLEAAARAALPAKAFINPNAPDFLSPGDMPNCIQRYCERTGQPVPQTKGEIMACIYHSLAMEYRRCLSLFEQSTQQKYNAIHIIGGGVQDALLCQMTADVCGCSVIAGPVEATALGNIAVQLIAHGEWKDLRQARQLIEQITCAKEYQPGGAQDYDQAYQIYTKGIEQQ